MPCLTCAMIEVGVGNYNHVKCSLLLPISWYGMHAPQILSSSCTGLGTDHVTCGLLIVTYLS